MFKTIYETKTCLAGGLEETHVALGQKESLEGDQRWRSGLFFPFLNKPESFDVIRWVLLK